MVVAGEKKEPYRVRDFNNAAHKDFTCSLTNHNVSWLTIYKAVMLYLDHVHVCYRGE